jgi:hypothetical protein
VQHKGSKETSSVTAQVQGLSKSEVRLSPFMFPTLEKKSLGKMQKLRLFKSKGGL